MSTWFSDTELSTCFYCVVSLHHNHTDIAVARKQISKGINSLYSLCLKYKIDFKLGNISGSRLSQWSCLWHYVALSNKFISNEMVKNIIEDLIESNLTLDTVYKLLSTLNKTGQYQCANETTHHF